MTDCRILRIRGCVDGRRRARPACTLLSLAPSAAWQGYVVEAEENRRSSSHPRTDVTHQLSLRLTRQRADRPFLSLFSLFSAASDCYAPDARACTCVRVRIEYSVCVRACANRRPLQPPRPIRAFDSFPSFFVRSVLLARSRVLLSACASTLFTTRPRRFS